MDQLNQGHPSDEALERFVLDQCGEIELETIETHSLACDFCVDRLEMLDIDIAATKRALQNMQRQSSSQRTASQRSNQLLFLGASAVLAACLVLSVVPSRVALSATRGSEPPIISTWRPVDLHLDVNGLDHGPVLVQLKDSQGSTLWQDKANIVGNADLNVRLPRIRRRGIYFVRICAVSPFKAEGELLREFALLTRSPL